MRTAWLLLKELGRIHVPVWKHWRLNERSYGALTGHSQLGYPTGGTPQSSARRAGEESGISPAGTALFNR